MDRSGADDLESIKRYLDEHYPQFAEPTVRTIYHRIQALRMSPNRGRPGHIRATRELVLSPLRYVVVYVVTDRAIEILHLHHGAQDWR